MIVDCHTHIFPESFIRRRDELLGDPCFRELYSNPAARMCPADKLIESMDRAGIAVSVVAAIGWSTSQMCRQHNDYIMEAADRYPGRLIGLGMVQPLETEQMTSELERISRGGLKGIGELRPDLQRLDTRSEAVTGPFMRALAGHNMVLLLHATEPVGHLYPGKGSITPEVVYPLISGHPGVKVILAHWGGGMPFYELQPEVGRMLGGVYYDTAATPYLYKENIYGVVAGLVGAQKILFGSDYPLIKQERALAHFETSELSHRDRELILGKNAARLFELEATA